MIIMIALSLVSIGQNSSPATVQSSSEPKLLSVGANSQDEDPFSKFSQFSALMSGSLMGPEEEAKIYRMGSKIRTNSVDGGYVVSDVNTYETFVKLANNKGCIKGTPPGGRTFPYLVLGKSKVERTRAGEETIDGHFCEIENVTITQESGHEIKLKIWEAQDLQGFPIKIEQDGVGTPRIAIYKNVSFAPPDPKLFKPPAHCLDL
ncbi:MAG TPA: hypothetical protein VFA74_07590 [Terriglobales bacterium]|nr:hypothetical protein [Terriglobales bacterium]